VEAGKENERMMAEGVERTREGRAPFIGRMEHWGGGNGRRRRTNARPLMVFVTALTGRFNPQIKGEITSRGGGVMEHVARKRGKASHGGLGVVVAQA
jgi:hypothetical protein